MPSSASPQDNSGFLHRFFTNNPQSIHDEIHATLNDNKRAATVATSPSVVDSSSSSSSSTKLKHVNSRLQENMELAFKSLGFSTSLGESSSASSSTSSAPTTTTAVVRKTAKHPQPFFMMIPQQQQQHQQRDFETKPTRRQNYAYAAAAAASSHSSCSYQIHQGNQQIQVDIDANGLSQDDLQVQVVNMPACVVQWSATTSATTGATGAAATGGGSNSTSSHLTNRLRLGSSVDCQRLSANLHQGVLRVKAPLKTAEEAAPVTNIPITTTTTTTTSE